MKLKKSKLIIAFGILLFTACGGGGSSDPFGPVPSESPLAGLVSDWELTSEITESNCDSLALGTIDIREITISEDNCINHEDDPDVGLEGLCQAGLDVVIVTYNMDFDSDGCVTKWDETANLQYDAENDSLTGTFTSSLSVSGSCSDDVETMSCSFSGTVNAEKITTPSITEDDTDGDGIENDSDNCPDNANADQTDTDGDGTGDACEADTDADGIIDDNDNCPNDANVDQADTDGNGTGDACEGSTDTDGDGVADGSDNCPNDANADQADTDADETGDVCDADVDGDGLCDNGDLCDGNAIDPDPANANDWYWVDSTGGATVTFADAPFLPIYRLYERGSYNGDEISVFGVVEAKDQTNIYSFCNGNYGVLIGICIAE